MTGDVTRGSVRVNGVDLAYLETGPRDGPLALCLHGFPDDAHSWDLLLPALADAGYRAVAPWMRGYNPSGPAPAGVYEPGALGADAVALHDVFGADDRAVLIGHDWGAVASYSAAAWAPERWRCIVGMAVPPIRAWLPQALVHPDQLRRSWYLFAFQLPWLPERLLGPDTVERTWSAWGGYRLDGTRREQLRRTFADPGSRRAALAYYRTPLRPWRLTGRYRAATMATLRIPPQPMLYVHGTEDGAVGVRYAEPTRRLLAPGSDVLVVDGAGHWAHLERADLVNGHLLAFLDRH